MPVEASKAFYKRNRPYVGNADTRTCDPRTLGSSTGGLLSYAYPSGHAAYGWFWSQILISVAPERAAPLAAFGRHLGDNRIVCRVHWPSDVAAGRKLADAMLAKLAVVPAYQFDLAAAKVELARAPAAKGC